MEGQSEEITIRAVTIGTCKFTVNRAEYEQALRDDELDFLFDAHVSDMDENTAYVTPDGKVHDYPSGEVIENTWATGRIIELADQL